MKWNHKHGFLGSLLAFIVGTSCCWLTSLGIWLGGTSILGALAMGIESKQTAILSFATGMAVFSAWWYWRGRGKRSAKK